MIGKARTGTSFGGLSGYLMREESQARDAGGLQDYLLDDAGRVGWTEVRNLPTQDPELAARMMSATAEQNVRVQKPVYHLSLSLSPDEHLTRQQWGQVVDRVLGEMGLKEHQALIVAHRDAAHPHVHVMINRVHPDHHKAWSTSHDYHRIERVLRHLERDMKLREVPGHHYRLEGQERPGREGKPTAGERQQQERTGQDAWADQVRFRTYNDFKEAENWGDLERRLAGHRLRLQRRGGGLVVTDGRRRVKASRIYRRGSYHWLEKRFGMSFEQWREGRRDLLATIDRYQQTDRERQRLARREDDAWAAFVKARERVEHRERIRGASQRTARRLDRAFRELYRPEDLPQVRRRFMADVRAHGWEAAAQQMVTRPDRYGRPVGRWRNRKRRKVLFRNVISYARDMGLLRGARAASPAALSAFLTASRAWTRLRHQRRRLLESKGQLLEIAGKVAALGVSAVSATLAPRPLKVAQLALQTLELARDLTRGRGR